MLQKGCYNIERFVLKVKLIFFQFGSITKGETVIAFYVDLAPG